jgi:hypothetical protein
MLLRELIGYYFLPHVRKTSQEHLFFAGKVISFEFKVDFLSFSF